MFLAITEFQQSLSNRCHRGYEETIARIIREQLETVIFQLLANGQEEKDFKEQGLKILSICSPGDCTARLISGKNTILMKNQRGISNLSFLI